MTDYDAEKEPKYKVIEDLVLAIGKIIVESDGKNDTMVLDILEQKFYLEISVKLKEGGVSDGME